MHQKSNTGTCVIKFIEMSGESKVRLDSSQFLLLGNDLLIHSSKVTYGETQSRRFRSIFGTTPYVCSILWDKIREFPEEAVPKNASPRHLLWTLFFLKTYPTEASLASGVGGVDEKTVRKWIWIIIEAISFLETDVVSEQMRYFVNYLI